METNINLNLNSKPKQPEQNNDGKELFYFIMNFIVFVMCTWYLVPIVSTIGFFKVLFIAIAANLLKDSIVYFSSLQ